MKKDNDFFQLCIIYTSIILVINIVIDSLMLDCNFNLVLGKLLMSILLYGLLLLFLSLQLNKVKYYASFKKTFLLYASFILFFYILGVVYSGFIEVALVLKYIFWGSWNIAIAVLVFLRLGKIEFETEAKSSIDYSPHLVNDEE